MRIIPVEVSFEMWNQGNTFEIQILHFDWSDGDTCLVGVGWYQGKFWLELFFWRLFRLWMK